MAIVCCNQPLHFTVCQIWKFIPRNIIGINLFFNLLVTNRELTVLSITGMVLFCFFLYIPLNFLSEQTYSRLVLTLLSIFFLTTAIHAIRQEQKEFETNRQTIFFNIGFNRNIRSNSNYLCGSSQRLFFL